MSALRRALPALLVALAGVVGIAVVQPTLASNTHKLRQRDDVFLLPPPAQLRAMTLGYRAAATDILWAKLILEYGLHAQEKRPFPDVTRYVDGIIAIEPDFPLLYDFVDTIIMYPAPPGATEEDARITRRYLERGTRERPNDPKVWLHYGQFIAFLAPTFLKERREIDEWRHDGALAMAHAVELGADTERSLAVSTMLSNAGERKATIEHLQRAYAMTDDPQIREQFLLKLRVLQADADAERAVTFVERTLRSRYPFLPRGAGLLIGPSRPATTCAGPASYARRGCARDWQQAIDESTD
jgi:hypothetical protein